jgi:beta-glucanase (GH16 family)
VQYGNIEIRAKLATGEGLWPAFWMLGSNIDDVGWPACGEIDIMEYVSKKQNTFYTSLHTTNSHGETINTKKSVVSNLEEGFHIYKMNWTENSILFSVDGSQVYVFKPSTKNEENWPFNKPFYFLLNVAIGGNLGGPQIDDTIFPREFIIDYIKHYKN